MSKRLKYLFLLACLNVQCAVSGGLDQLHGFIESTRTLSTQFSQTVIDRNGRKVQEAQGGLQISRPGKFRWIYEKPYSQVLVGDGKKLWIYDQDLEQVTVRSMDQAIGESPAALLAGDNALEQHFNLRETGSQEGLEWLEARPKSPEGSFEMVRMGFKGNALVAMEVRDNFGQTTRLRFTRLQRNPALADSLLRFTPPKGVDVLGDK